MNLECIDLSIGYRQPIAENINFSLAQGDFLCVLGANGTGKTTLIKTILGIMHPLAGKVLYDGPKEHYRIAYLPQHLNVQQEFPATVEEVVLSGMMVHQHGFFYGQKAKKKADDIMCRLNIRELKKRSYKQLSGGQRQRVLLARALCADNELLVVDEPVNGLDAQAKKQMYAMLAKLQQEENMTVIMVSHDVQQAIRYATHILDLQAPMMFLSKAAYIKNKQLEISSWA